ncbi:MAG: hypothetical protein OJF47_001084 [Nitrospira sp.]|nr:MAG: hypothetical protein OJF47_001084 [Nitrospira sp.]
MAPVLFSCSLQVVQSMKTVMFTAQPSINAVLNGSGRQELPSRA